MLTLQSIFIFLNKQVTFFIIYVRNTKNKNAEVTLNLYFILDYYFLIPSDKS